MPAIELRPKPRPVRRTRLVAVLALAVLATVVPTGVSAAVAPMSFGTVSVGATKTLSTTVPLIARLSELPPGTLIYTGGIASIDSALVFAGMTLPVTAASLMARTGDITVTYKLSPTVSSQDFLVVAPTCLTASVSCSADVTFAPRTAGPIAGRVHWILSGIVVSGGGSLGSLVQLMSNFISNQFSDSQDILLSGIAVPSTDSVNARVDIAASAACIELNTSAVDFGSTTLGAADVAASPTITVTNCSGVGETLYARGTDASGQGSAWTLVDSASTCATDLGLDRYRLSLAVGPNPVPLGLSTSNKGVQSLASGEDLDQVARIHTACPGSTGAGVVMAMQIHYLVTSD